MSDYGFLPTGIHGLEYMLEDRPPKNCPDGGWFLHPKEEGLSILLHGAPGTGKTTVCLQMAVRAHQEGHRVIFLSRDMSTSSLIQRIETFGYFGKGTCSFLELDSVFAEGNHTDKDKELRSCAEILDQICDPDLNEETKLRNFLQESVLKDTNDRGIRGQLLRALYNESKDGNEDGKSKAEDKDGKYYPIVLGRIQLTGVSTGYYRERYEPVESALEALIHISPNYNEFFRAMEKIEKTFMSRAGAEGQKKGDEKRPGFLIILDSFPQDFLEEYFAGNRDGYFLPSNATKRGVAHFMAVMESRSGPFEEGAAFPPDVQIELAMDREAEAKPLSTIRLAKTRFQKARKETFAYEILSRSEENAGAKEKIAAMRELTVVQSGGGCRVPEETEQTEWKKCYLERKPGINIFPSQGSLKRHLSPTTIAEPLKNLEFQRLRENSLRAKAIAKSPEKSRAWKERSLDGLTTEGSLSAGMTLVVAENGCHSSELALHYLIGQLGKARSPDHVNASLYISLFSDIGAILHRIFTLGYLRERFFREDNDYGKVVEYIKTLSRKCEKRLSELDSDHGKHLPIYRLQTVDSAELLVLQAGTAYCEPEEVLERLARILDPHSGGCVQRVVFDRTSRAQKRWPLIENPHRFIETIAYMCKHWGIDLMIIDDQAQGHEYGSHFESSWTGLSNNILQLSKVTFQGHEETKIELPRAEGRTNASNRPYELCIQTDPEGEFPESRLVRLDSYRGFSGLRKGEPKPCSIRIDLTYDEKHTPLHRHMMRLQRDVNALLPKADVRLLGGADFSGINGAFGTHISSSWDGCHIAAIDGMWVSQLLRAGALEKMLPDQAAEVMGIDNCGGTTAIKDLQERAEYKYVTRALTVATGDVVAGEYPCLYAVPFRHNWGVLAVSEVDDERVFSLLKEHRLFRNKSDAELDRRLREIAQRIRSLLPLPDGAQALTWMQIKERRGKFSEIVEELRALAPNDANMPYIGDFGIECFDLTHSTRESVTCFLLELLLSRLGRDLFDGDGDGIGPLDFANPFAGNADQKKKGWIEALELFYELLSPLQRREIGVGVDTEDVLLLPRSSATDESPSDPVSEPGTKRRHCGLFSREWLTTVPDLLVSDDPRTDVYMMPLPLWGEEYQVDCSLDSAKGLGVDGFRGACSKAGPTVAGTWYLGVLSGGDTELATPLMKQMTSEHHELERLYDRGGAPVSASLYNVADPETGPGEHGLPYSAAISCLADELERLERQADSATRSEHKKSVERALATVPFVRSRIRAYTKVATTLYDLVRHVMRLPEGDTLRDQIEKVLKRELGRIVSVQKEAGHDREEKGKGARP